MELKFGQQSSDSNGQAAYVLVLGLLHVLKDKGVLTPDEATQAVINAERYAPNQPNARDREVREMLATLKMYASQSWPSGR